MFLLYVDINKTFTDHLKFEFWLLHVQRFSQRMLSCSKKAALSFFGSISFGSILLNSRTLSKYISQSQWLYRRSALRCSSVFSNELLALKCPTDILICLEQALVHFQLILWQKETSLLYLVAWGETLRVSCQNFDINLFSCVSVQICVTAGIKSFDPNISHLNICHFCVVYSLCLQCRKAFSLFTSV